MTNIASFLCLMTLSAGGPDYHKDVLPILNNYCVGCHNGDDDQGGFNMDTYKQLLAGGKRGASLVPGKSHESLLTLTVEGKKKPKMPPKGEPAPNAKEIDILKKWIDAGAVGADDPSGITKLETPSIPPKGAPKVGVNALVYHPKRDLVAFGGYGTVTLVDPKTSFIEAKLDGHIGNITSLQFSGDGAKLIVGAGEPGLFGEVKIWNVADAKLLHTLTGHKDSLYAAEISPDGKTIASAGYDKDIKLWNSITGAEIKTLDGHQDAIYGLAFSTDGRFLASACGDRTVKLWDVAKGERLDTFTQATRELFTIDFSPTSSRMAAGGVDKRIRVWQISKTGKETTNPLLVSRFAHESPIIKLAYSPDGKWLLSSAEDRTVKLWEAESMKEKFLLEKQPEWSAALAFAGDSQSFVVGRFDGSLAVYQTADGKKAKDLKPMPKPPAKPELASPSPRAIERGKTTKVRLMGKNLAGATAVTFNTQAIKATIAKEPAPKAGEIWIEATPTKELGRGLYRLALTTPGGKTMEQPIYVDDLPVILEAEPNDSLQAVKAVALPATFVGDLNRAGDSDYFSFEAKKGQTVIIDIGAATIESKVDAVATILDSTGKVLAANNDSDHGTDSLLAFTIPVDGQYIARIHDLQYRGGADNFYVMSIGDVPVTTSFFPLSVPANQETEVTLIGKNLPAGTTVKVKAEAPGKASLPIDWNKVRPRRGMSPMVVVDDLPPTAEKEPNDIASAANMIAAPGVANGRIDVKPGANEAAGDFDIFKFRSKKGEEWIIEAKAKSVGSPTDTRIEILDAAGKPVERIWMQAVRDAQINFRSIESGATGLRTSNAEEFGLNQYMYLSGEVCKIFQLPRGPDSDFNFYANRGNRRRAYFDTTPTTHGFGDTVYIVEPQAPGTSLIPNGLPVLKLNYENDDISDQTGDTDSRLTFTAPADGEYLVRVRDTRARGGDVFAYQLVVRKPAPDFEVTRTFVGKVTANSGFQVMFGADRIDNFDGDILVEVTNMPPGFAISGPTVIQSGHHTAWAVITAAENAEQPTKEQVEAIKISASATINGSVVHHEVKTFDKLILEKTTPPVLVRLSPPEIVITPGTVNTITLKITRNDLDKDVLFDERNLPHGIIVDNLGLNGITIPGKETERTLYLNCADWVPDTDRPFFVTTKSSRFNPKEEGRQASNAIIVRVRGQKQVAGTK